MLQRFLFVLFFSLFFQFSFGQDTHPKHELRAVWIATVGNIDWPSKRGLSSLQQQTEFKQMLDYFQSCGFNAVIVQIRPAADAFYASPHEPWSVYLSGKQGLAPFPKYDPLTFMIQETHKRNMEFHAWFNPFRALVNSTRNPNPPEHATIKHPDWIINYGGKSYFDPGNPDARKYILNVITDVVKRYDIDAVHIDDYFYPYKIAEQAFPDNASFEKYNNGLNREDWRRNNVNLFVSQLNHQIKKEKPWLQFGISPFGIWRNKRDDAVNGSATNGTSCYDDLYSDILLWTKKNWVDYVAPQLYWTRSSKAASYSVLLPWWMQHKNRAQIYIGLGLYNMVNAKPGTAWHGSAEILEQIRMARKEKANGLIFFSASSFSKISPSFYDSLKNNYFSTIAIPPAKPWLSEETPKAPELNLVNIKDGTAILQWDSSDDRNPESRLSYLVYRFDDGEKINLSNSKKIIALTQNKNFQDKSIAKGAKYRYVVTALNRFWNESESSNIVDCKEAY